MYLSMHWAWGGVCPGESTWGGVTQREECLHSGESALGGVCLRGVFPRGGVSQHAMGQTPPCGQTPVKKQTSFAGGNEKMTLDVNGLLH